MRKPLQLALFAASISLAHIICAAPCRAQDVEIDVAGPWSYVPDGNRVMLVAPDSANHEVDVFSGGDVQNVSGALQPHKGHYQLEVPTFDHANCPSSPIPMSSGPYPLKIDPQTLKTIITAKNVYTISLPKPCSYESYAESRAKVDTTSVSETTPEKSYTTWMVLHYKVSAASLRTFVKGTANDGTTYDNGTANNDLLFSASTAHPPSTAALAISLVLYNVSMGFEDPVCDQHSADSFDDEIKTLWGQTNLNRLFPELFDTGARPREQSHRYNYTKCTQVLSGSAMRTSASPVTPFLQAIGSIRKELSDSEFKDARTQLEKLRAQLTEFWHGRLPDLIRDDLDNTRREINKAIEEKKCAVVDAQSALALTMYSISPGRTDCHSPQVSVNGAVN